MASLDTSASTRSTQRQCKRQLHRAHRRDLDRFNTYKTYACPFAPSPSRKTHQSSNFSLQRPIVSLREGEEAGGYLGGPGFLL